MEINALLNELNSAASTMQNSFCIINRAVMDLDEIQKMGIQEFSLRAKINMPLKLYKYFPNLSDHATGVNYSLQALKNNTVFMQSPSNFDDVYDSDISLDYLQYEKLRLMEYCLRCEICVNTTDTTQELKNKLLGVMVDSLQSKGNISYAFVKKPDSELEKLSTDKFILDFQNEFMKTRNMADALDLVISNDFTYYAERLKNTFRVSCFSTSPFSQLMWGGSYADCHRGFCIEYTILPNDSQYQEIYCNLFPLIYCKTRPNMTEILTKAQDKPFDYESMWNIYFHGALRKSVDWAYQNEWRLLLPMRAEKISDYNIPFFPITKVFLGNRMSAGDRNEIIRICHEKSYPYAGVTRNPLTFEMQECGILCEKCEKHLNRLLVSSIPK